MKKLYALAAAAVLAFGASAQLYVCGSGDGLAWEPASPLVVNLSNNAYTFTVENLASFKMSTAMGDWDTFNGSALWGDITEASVGTNIELVAGDGNIDTPWTGTWTIKVSANLATMVATTTTPKPNLGDAKVFYLRGDMNNWLNDMTTEQRAEWQFVQNPTKPMEYTFDCSNHMIAAGTGFKIADGSWGSINYGAGGEVVADPYPAEWNYNANNSFMAEDYTGIITVVLPEVARQPILVTLAPANAGVDNVAVEAGVKEYFNLQGVRVANPENGLYIVRQGGKTTKVMR